MLWPTHCARSSPCVTCTYDIFKKHINMRRIWHRRRAPISAIRFVLVGRDCDLFISRHWTDLCLPVYNDDVDNNDNNHNNSFGEPKTMRRVAVSKHRRSPRNTNQNPIKGTPRPGRVPERPASVVLVRDLPRGLLLLAGRTRTRSVSDVTETREFCSVANPWGRVGRRTGGWPVAMGVFLFLSCRSTTRFLRVVRSHILCSGSTVHFILCNRKLY